MSQARAKEFIKALEADANLRNKVNQASEQIVKVANDNGYDVTREEIGAALKAHWEAEEGFIDPHNRFFSEAPGF